MSTTTTTTAAKSAQVNWPNATGKDWEDARRFAFRGACLAGFSQSTADDLAQNACMAVRKRRYTNATPASPLRAIRVEVRNRRRFGWWPLMDRDAARQFRGDMTECQRAAEMATMAIHRQRAANLTPHQMAERAEQWNGIQRGAAIRAARAASLYDALAASQGIGPAAHDHEQEDAARWTAAVPSSRPPHRLPLQGCPGLHTDTDPAPGSHARAAEECRRHAAVLAE